MNNEETVIISGQAEPNKKSLAGGWCWTIAALLFLIVPFMVVGSTSSGNNVKVTVKPQFLAITIALIIPAVRCFQNYSKSKKTRITVTNMRILGIDASGNRVDLPFNRLSHANLDANGTLTITAADSTYVTFTKMYNSPKILEEITRLTAQYKTEGYAQMQQPMQPQIQKPVQPQVQQLVQPQVQQPVQPQIQQPVQPQVQRTVQPQIQQPVQLQVQQPVQPKPQAETVQAPLSVADELKKFKELLDMGVISQQEFDDMKRQLLAQ